MRKLTGGAAGEDGKSAAAADRGAVYLNEICLTVQPCDLVLNCPVFVALLDMLKLDRVKAISKATVAKEVDVAMGKTVDSVPALSSVNLPLVYINASNLRLLVPRCLPPPTGADEEFVVVGSSETGSQSRQGYVMVGSEKQQTGNIAVGSEESSQKKKKQEMSGDLCMLQVTSLAVQPHAGVCSSFQL